MEKINENFVKVNGEIYKLTKIENPGSCLTCALKGCSHETCDKCLKIVPTTHVLTKSEI